MLTRILFLGVMAFGLLATLDAAPARAQKVTPSSVGQLKMFHVIQVKFKSKNEAWSRWAAYPTRAAAEAYLLTLLRSRNFADTRIITEARYVPIGTPKLPVKLP